MKCDCGKGDKSLINRCDKPVLTGRGETMKAKIEIKIDNAAFDELAPELARILRELAQRVENGDWPMRSNDANGNHVGDFKIIGKAVK